MKFRANIATDQIDANGEQYILDGLCTSLPVNLPVLVDFDIGLPVGHADVLEIEPNGAYVRGELIANLLPVNEWPNGWWVVPGGITREYHQQGSVVVIDQFQVTCLGLTHRPADKHLTMMEIE